MQVSKTVLIMLSLIVFILFAVIGAGTFLLLSKGALFNQNEELVSTTEDTNNPAIYKAHINNMILNVINRRGREKLMKLSFSIKSSEPMIEQVVEENREIMIDKIIFLTSQRSTDELLTLGGKILFKEELRDEINTIFNKARRANEELQQDMVKKILYTSFVIK